MLIPSPISILFVLSQVLWPIWMLLCISSYHLTDNCSVSPVWATTRVLNLFLVSVKLEWKHFRWRPVSGGGGGVAFRPQQETLMTHLFLWQQAILTQEFTAAAAIWLHYNNSLAYSTATTVCSHRSVYLSLLLCIIAFLSWRIYEKPRDAGSSPGLQKKKKDGSMKLSDENHLSLLFSVSRLTQNVLIAYLAGRWVFCWWHAYCSSGSNDSVCFATR